jgi:DNA anti-recombination protein RmuC
MSNKVNAQQIYEELIKLRKKVEELEKLKSLDTRISKIEKYIDSLESFAKEFGQAIQKIKNIFTL